MRINYFRSYKLQALSKNVKLILVLLAAILLRMYFATWGHNYDMESWGIVSDIVLDGDIIYAKTDRYNYAYLWGLILASLKALMFLLGQSGIETFHLYIVGFLSIVDIGIAAWLKKYFGQRVALLFLFNPVSILLTGFHSQFENLALLFALISVIPLLKAEIKTKQIVLSGLLLGLSLVTKHLFFLFPIWFLFRPNFSIKNRVLYILVSVGFFVVSFMPFIFSEESFNGIINNIVVYNGFGANSMFVYVLYFLIGDFSGINFYAPSVFPYLKVIFIVLLTSLGYAFRKQEIKLTVLLYPLALLTTTCMILSEYYVIAVLIACVFSKHLEAKVFVLFTTLYLAFIPNAYNIGMLDTLNIFPEHIRYYFLYCLHPNMIQFFLSILLLRIIYKKALQGRSMNIGIRNQ